MPLAISVPRDALADLCRRYGIRELSVFGSVLREDFRPDSDVDVLVEFEPGATVSLFGLVEIRDELSSLFGRPVDLVERECLSPFIRDRVLLQREVLYSAQG